MAQLLTASTKSQQKANVPRLKAIINNIETQVEYSEYDNVMIALSDFVDWGSCGGSATCGTCVCSILSGEEYFPLPDFFEEEILEFVGKPNLRLGCQLELENVPNDKLVVRVENG